LSCNIALHVVAVLPNSICHDHLACLLSKLYIYGYQYLACCSRQYELKTSWKEKGIVSVELIGIW
jgi:hypothetical protein